MWYIKQKYTCYVNYGNIIIIEIYNSDNLGRRQDKYLHKLASPDIVKDTLSPGYWDHLRKNIALIKKRICLPNSDDDNDFKEFLRILS